MAGTAGQRYRIQVTDEDVVSNRDLLRELVVLARDNYGMT